jgi:hypothetical protein
VDRAVLVQRIFNVQPDILPFAQTDERGGNGAVNADRMAFATVDRHHLMCDLQADILAGDGRKRPHDACGNRLSPSGKPASEGDRASAQGSAAQ